MESSILEEVQGTLNTQIEKLNSLLNSLDEELLIVNNGNTVRLKAESKINDYITNITTAKDTDLENAISEVGNLT